MLSREHQAENQREVTYQCVPYIHTLLPRTHFIETLAQGHPGSEISDSDSNGNSDPPLAPMINTELGTLLPALLPRRRIESLNIQTTIQIHSENALYA